MEENGYPFVEDNEISSDLLKAVCDSDGKRKKIIVCFISISGLAQNKETAIDKLKEVLGIFKENSGSVAMIYHFDPAINEFLGGYDRRLYKLYRNLIERMKKEDFFIPDESLENDFLVRLCDGFYGDCGNLMYKFTLAGKPVMCINYEILDNERVYFEDLDFSKDLTEVEDYDREKNPDESYDVLIVITSADYDRVKRNYKRLADCIPGRNVIFIGSEEVGRKVADDNISDRFKFIDENDLLPYKDVESVMKDILHIDEIPRGMVGWYYQQFLKMTYALNCKDEYYMVWDGDTIPCRNFKMFDESGTPFFDLKQEFCENYFITLERLFPGLRKCIDRSFISEHMLIKTEYMKEMMETIMINPNLMGSTYYERVLRTIDTDKLKASSFSEFETYGTYVSIRHMGSYNFRNWHSFRYCGNFFDPDTITDVDYEWLGRDFEAVSFEKRATRTEESMSIFQNPKYREKLSARQIVEAIQEESEGYKEVW
ncbi:MAG: DUF6492 family protein [Lachnospiraceae bacterium]|nr:DUF6492 family protein [Lachnospiraceae bacterium]